jgi:hypothetical protein
METALNTDRGKDDDEKGQPTKHLQNRGTRPSQSPLALSIHIPKSPST